MGIVCRARRGGRLSARRVGRLRDPTSFGDPQWRPPVWEGAANAVRRVRERLRRHCVHEHLVPDRRPRATPWDHPRRWTRRGPAGTPVSGRSLRLGALRADACPEWLQGAVLRLSRVRRLAASAAAADRPCRSRRDRCCRTLERARSKDRVARGCLVRRRGRPRCCSGDPPTPVGGGQPLCRDRSWVPRAELQPAPATSGPTTAKPSTPDGRARRSLRECRRFASPSARSAREPQTTRRFRLRSRAPVARAAEPGTRQSPPAGVLACAWAARRDIRPLTPLVCGSLRR